MKNLLISLAGLLLVSNNALATDYIYRDLMANTLASPVCSSEHEASALASKAYNIDKYSKRFCQSQGYGWHVESVNDVGKIVCTECGAAQKGKKQCHIEDMTITCKRIKPGSVGMLPGQG